MPKKRKILYYAVIAIVALALFALPYILASAPGQP